MSHNFIPSIKKGVRYCSYCGCLSYKNIPSKKSHISKNQGIMNIDPLILKYKPISLKIDFSLISHKNYMNNRNKGLSKIIFLSYNFKLDRMIKYKAIGLMDQIYLNNEDISIENIEAIASTSVILSLEYNDCYINSNKIMLPAYFDNPKNNPNINNINNNSFYINNKKALYQYIRNEIKSIIYWQTYCLKKIDYNLCKYTSFDYINLFFALGIIFTKNEVDIINMYEGCFSILDIIISNQYYCKYNQYIVAMSIIYLIFKNSEYFNTKVFKYIYGVDFSKEKYKLCINDINSFLTNLYKREFNNTFSNINININENNYYFNNYFVNNNNNNYFSDEKTNNDFQLNPKSDINNSNELIFKYINLIESIISNNYMIIIYKKQLLFDNIFKNRIIENNSMSKNNSKLKVLDLTFEDSEQKNRKRIIEEK